MSLQYKIGGETREKENDINPKEAKAKMKTKAIYYGDYFTHITQWLQWNKSLFKLQSAFAEQNT